MVFIAVKVVSLQTPPFVFKVTVKPFTTDWARVIAFGNLIEPLELDQIAYRVFALLSV
jgi:hypothetical protein